MACYVNDHNSDSYFAGPIQTDTARTKVNGSRSGSAEFSEPFTGANYKKVIIYCLSRVGTASYTLPSR